MANHFASAGRDPGLQEKYGAETSALVAEGLWRQSGWPSSHSSYKYFFIYWSVGGGVLFALDTEGGEHSTKPQSRTLVPISPP